MFGRSDSEISSISDCNVHHGLILYTFDSLVTHGCLSLPDDYETA